MKRIPKSATIPKDYAAAWVRLFARSPDEIEAERKARVPSPPPQMTGTRQGLLQAPQRTQTAGVLPVYHSPKE